MDSCIGKILDQRFQLNECIGKGGMANVYKATDLTTGQTVAVKVLRSEFADNEEFLRRFRNESKAIASLNHPNIVRVVDIGNADGMEYIAMEYVNGITLKDYMEQQGALRWKDAVHFTVQILRA